MTLNITSGEYFNNYIKNKYDGKFIPFNESMITGQSISKILTDEFIEVRAEHHNVSTIEYINKLYNLNNPDFINSFNEINLWFGLDTFCQINMLTLLAYLDQINYSGLVYFIGIDDYTNEIIKEKELVQINNFSLVYNSVIINKNTTKTLFSNINKAIEEYLQLANGTDEISLFIKNNLNLKSEDLLIKSLNISKELGLSDIIIKSLIDKYKFNKYELYYQNDLIGTITLDLGTNIASYNYLNNKQNIFEFLKYDVIDNINNLPFFKSRIDNMNKFKLTEVKYQNDFYLLKRIN